MWWLWNDVDYLDHHKIALRNLQAHYNLRYGGKMGEQIICVSRSAFEEIAKSLCLPYITGMTRINIPNGVTKILYDPELDKPKMTREEALQKLNNIHPLDRHANNKVFLEKMEALGLLKFEEERMPICDECLNNMLKAGYKISKP